MVDLPAPERPITPTNWPGWMSSVTFSTARVSPKVRVRFFRLSVAVMGPAPFVKASEIHPDEYS